MTAAVLGEPLGSWQQNTHLQINMDVHQAPCPPPRSASLCAPPLSPACQRIADSVAPESLINILRWFLMLAVC